MATRLMISQASPLTPAPDDKIREAVVKVFAAYPASGSAEAVESAVGTYVATLAEYPMKAIVEAAQAFLSGRVAGHNPAFRPSVTQWAIEARKRRDAMRAADYLALAKPPGNEQSKNVGLSPEEMQRRSKVVEQAMAALKKRIAPPKTNRQEILDASPKEALAALASQPIRVSADLIQRINQGQ